MQNLHAQTIAALEPDGIPEHGNGLELQNMMRPYDEDNSNDPGAPLLPEGRSASRSQILPETAGSLPSTTRYDATDSGITHGSGTWFIWALTLSAGFSGLLFGYDTGVISSTLISIGTDLSHRTLTTIDKSLITSSTSLFALVASPLAGTLGDRIGRKPVILIADALFVIGALWQAAAFEVESMIVGRSLVGLAVGTASLVTPLYIAELSPSALRGRLVTVLALFITGGQVVAYVAGWLLSNAPSGWRWMVGLGALPALIQLSILVFLPETPRWLVKVHKDVEARRVLTKVYGDGGSTSQTIDRVIRDIEQEIEEESSQPAHERSHGRFPTWLHSIPNNWTRLFRIPANRRALVIACMLQGFQQLCGFNSLMYFSATIFKLLAFSSPTLTSLSVAATNFIFTLLAFSLIDRLGRRRILLFSVPFMAIALLACATIFPNLDVRPTMHDFSDKGNSNILAGQSRLKPILILIFLTIYTAAYASGLGNVPWQQSELFPLQVRSLGSALATATNWGSNFLVGLTFLPLMEMISPGWTFFIYVGICVFGWLGVWAIYPEMSGMGLEDVRGLLSDGWGVEGSLERFAKRRDDRTCI